MIIVVVGSGVMGSALSFPARENGHEVRLVGTMLDREIISHGSETGYHITLERQLPGGVKFYQLEQLAEAMVGMDVLISGVSSFGVEWFADEIMPQVPSHIPVLSVTKGLLNRPNGEVMAFPDYYLERYPNSIQCAIGGPCTSYELADHDDSCVCFCGYDMDVLRKLRDMMTTPYYHISISNDVKGVECAVAIKNAYALGVTLAIGISEKRDGKQHYNSQAGLFGQSICEMRKLIEIIGGGEENIVYGAGDLYVTVFGGRSRKVGTLLGKGYTIDEAMKQLEGLTLESVAIAGRIGQMARELIELGKVDAADFPLLLHMNEIINRKAAVNIPWKAFNTETEIS